MRVEALGRGRTWITSLSIGKSSRRECNPGQASRAHVPPSTNLDPRLVSSYALFRLKFRFFLREDSASTARSC